MSPQIVTHLPKYILPFDKSLYCRERVPLRSEKIGKDDLLEGFIIPGNEKCGILACRRSYLGCRAGSQQISIQTTWLRATSTAFPAP